MITSVYFEDHLHEALKAQARRRRCSVSKLVRTFCKEGLERGGASMVSWRFEGGDPEGDPKGDGAYETAPSTVWARPMAQAQAQAAASSRRRECERAAHHRKGVFCKSCGETP